ncbi:MAG: O-antigen ligase family protein [Pseudomonadota bacterium]
MASKAAPTGWVVDRQNALLVMVMVAVSYTVSILPPGLIFDPAAREAAEGQDSPLFKMIWIPLILMTFAVLVSRFRMVSSMLPDLNGPLFVLLAWCLLSMVWAPDAAFAFKQAFSIIGATLLPLAFVVTGWYRQRMEVVLRQVSTILLVLSLLVAVAVPRIGVHDSTQFELQGSWLGITYQKNGLGQLAASSLILWCHAWLARSVSPRLALAGALLSVFLLLKSRSSTSLLLSIIACAVMTMQLRPILTIGKYRGIVAVSAALLVIVPTVVYFVLIGAVDSVAMAEAFGRIFGKDATFSGRTYIWAEMMHTIGQHPWLGFGFNSFWHTPAAGEIQRRLGWPVPSGHNGYLDIINTLGLIGFSLFLAFVVRHIQSLRKLMQFDRQQGALHTGLFLFVMLANLTESAWFLPIAPTHLLAMYSVMAVARLHYQHRLSTACAGARTSTDRKTMKAVADLAEPQAGR